MTFRLPEDQVRKLRSMIGRIPEELHRELRQAFIADTVEWEKALQARLRGGNPIKRRTGQLARSIRREVTGSTLKDLRAAGKSVGAPHAITQEFGGAIKPRRVKNLTIPTDDNLTAAGVPRFPSARALLLREGRAKGAPQRLPEAKFIKLPSGKVFLVRDTGTDVQFLFRLVKQVTIPPDPAKRMGFFATWNTQAPQRARRRAEAIKNALKAAEASGG